MSSPMSHSITMQAQAMNAQVNRQDVQTENPQFRSMVDRLRDFMRMNPLIFRGIIHQRILKSL